MIIDFHTHIYPPAVAAKILPAAKKKLKVAVPGIGSPEDLRSMMQSGEVSRAVLLPWPRAAGMFQASMTGFRRQPRKTGSLPPGAVHPFMEGLEEELDRLNAWGSGE